jgi:hypothetical protein
MTKTYVAIYEQDPAIHAWRARIDSVPGCQAEAGSIPSVQARLREVLGGQLGEHPASVLIDHRMPPAIAAVAKRANRARREAERAVARAQQEVSSAARELAALGLSRRDSAALLGMSHQRVQQLIEASARRSVASSSREPRSAERLGGTGPGSAA